MAVLGLYGFHDAGRVGVKECGVGCHAPEDVVEDVGGVGVAGVARGGVEEVEGGVGVLLGGEELKETVWVEGFGKVYHRMATTN